MKPSRTLGLAVVAGAVWWLAGCTEPPARPATVQLTIDGQSYDYQTDKAQFDQQVEGGRYSVYLLPPAGQPNQPYVCLRTYMGNPVAHVWIRYTKPGDDKEGGSELGKYECFVPGTLSDGRPTLGWTFPDGTQRKRTETGEESCQATLTKQGSQLHLTFEATLSRHLAKKKGRKAPTEAEIKADAIKATGSAVLELGK